MSYGFEDLSAVIELDSASEAESKTWQLCVLIAEGYHFRQTLFRVETAKDGILKAKAVLKIIFEKEDLPKKVRKYFSLYINAPDLEMEISADQNILEIAENWLDAAQHYTHLETDCSWFTMRRRKTISVHSERNIKDERVLGYLFNESWNEILRNPVWSSLMTADEYTELASIAAQITLEDNDFGSSHPFQLEHFIPSTVAGRTKHRSAYDWQMTIAKRRKPHKSQPKTISYLLYLQHLRMKQWYGCAWFAATNDFYPAGNFNLRVKKWVVGVNFQGIYVVDLDTHAMVFSSEYKNFHYQLKDNNLVHLIEHEPQLDQPSVPPIASEQSSQPSSRRGSLNNVKHSLDVHTPQALLIEDMILQFLELQEDEMLSIERARNEQHHSHESIQSKHSSKDTLPSNTGFTETPSSGRKVVETEVHVPPDVSKTGELNSAEISPMTEERAEVAVSIADSGM